MFQPAAPQQVRPGGSGHPLRSLLPSLCGWGSCAAGPLLLPFLHPPQHLKGSLHASAKQRVYGFCCPFVVGQFVLPGCVVDGKNFGPGSTCSCTCSVLRFRYGARYAIPTATDVRPERTPTRP